ncbi:MAG: ammonium transporter, partial [Candidatus Thorarchaeota archaeon]
GTGLLWFGWYGFNAGSELAVNNITVLAFLNTDLAASVAGFTWLILSWIIEKKPKFVGFLTGAVAGLAAVTPAAGYVSPGSAFIIGILAGIICFTAITFKNRRGWDDALDVWGVHGVGGFLGTISLGLFASATLNPAGADGLIFGGVSFFTMQVVAVIIAAVWAFVFTYVMLYIINFITPVRVTDVVESSLDEGQLGEKAYLD